MYPRVSIIILNWNGWKDTIECLESLYRITYPNYDVIVVDNGSKDNSIQKIKEYAEGKIKVNSKFFKYNPNSKPIRVFEIDEDEARRGKFNRTLYEKYDVDRRMILIKNKDNYGFAGGNNIGMKFALSILNPDYLLLLNNDTVVEPNFLTELVRVAESDKKIGIVGPMILFYKMPEKIQFAGIRLSEILLYKRPLIPETQDLKTPIFTDEVHGAAMLIKRSVIEKVGFFDESYFAYWEETDFCFRARKSNIRLFVIPSAKIWHKVGSRDVKNRQAIKPYATYLFARNQIIFIKKNIDGTTKPLSIILIGAKIPFFIITYLIYYKNTMAAVRFLDGIIDGAFKS
ncbi:glycosyltransferase family 2 protein [Thermococcus sp.]